MNDEINKRPSNVKVEATNLHEVIPPAITSLDNENSHHNILDDPTLLSALIDNENQHDTISINMEDDDEIVREIDVYISPELASTMHLIQFPLQPATSNSSFHHGKKGKTRTDDEKKPLPISANIKPNHELLELEFPIQTSSFSSQRQIPGVLNLPTRKYASENIPKVTHMAVGLFDNTLNKIDLIPLHRIMQMRPTFAHVDALFDDDKDHNPDTATSDVTTENDGNTSKPILFRKPESDKAILARRSSYAFKKASEDNEEWITLDIHGPGSLDRKETINKCYCSHASREKNIKLANSKVSANIAYVKSLNYIQLGTIQDDPEDFIIPTTLSAQGSIHNSIDADSEMSGNGYSHDLETEEGIECMRDLTTRVGNLLQLREGLPVPYPTIRSRFRSSVSDEILLRALSASSVLVRGNFVLKSSLMTFSSHLIANVRDLILLLLVKYGVIQREKLIRVYEILDDDDPSRNIVTKDTINSILETLTRKTLYGVEMKIDDDYSIESRFDSFSKKHADYWNRKEMYLQKYVTLYEEQLMK